MGRLLSVAKSGDLEIVMTRSFDAPRALVFDAWTKPELVRRWFGPRGCEVVECEIDLRVGGRWRYRLRHDGGMEMLLQGVYQEIDRPERLVSLETNEDCDASEGQALATLTLVEQGGVTTLTQVLRYGSKRIRDAVLESGMERGVGEGFDKLAEAVAVTAKGVNTMNAVMDRYRGRAEAFESKVAAVETGQWENRSPCAEWNARDVVGHIVDMHGAMLRPLGRELGQAPALLEDPLGAFRAARADVEAVLADPVLAATEHETPSGKMTAEQHIDQVVSADMVVHGWDLARATGQDDTIDPEEVARMWPGAQAIPDQMRIPGAFGPGIVVFGPEVKVPEDAPLQDRLLGLLGRDSNA